MIWCVHILGDESIDPAKFLEDLVDEGLNIGILGDVELVGLDLDAVLLGQLLDILVGALLAGRVGDGNVGAHLGTAAGGLDTHAAGSGSAGDDDNLALEAEEVVERRSLGDLLNHDGRGLLKYGVMLGDVVRGANWEQGQKVGREVLKKKKSEEGRRDRKGKN